MRFFAWERGLKGPTPAVYYGSMPKDGGGKALPTLAVHDVTSREDLFDMDGSPRFSALAEAFPLAPAP